MFGPPVAQRGEGVVQAAHHADARQALVLAAHGTLHLVGYTDDTTELRNKMNAVAEKIAKEFI